MLRGRSAGVARPETRNVRHIDCLRMPPIGITSHQADHLGRGFGKTGLGLWLKDRTMSRQNSIYVSICATFLTTGCGYIADFDSPLPKHSIAGSAGENTRAGASNSATHAGGVAGAALDFPGGAGFGGVYSGVADAGGAAGWGGTSSPSGGMNSTFVSSGGGTGGSSAPSSGGGTSTLCAENESRNCSVAGLLGRCASGIQRCSSGQWGACSIAPAPRDTCTPGNDDNCNGTPNDTACTVQQVAAGSNHTCALLSDGMVRCWGANNAGQLGNGTTILSGEPKLVSDLTGVNSIAARGDNTCAVLADGSVRCWGQRADGLIGEDQSGLSTLPTALAWSFTLPISTVSVGGGFACAVTKAEATVRCWGRGDLGQLGDGIMHVERVPSPVMASGVAGVTSLSAGSSHVCAALSDSTVKCWGSGEKGENGSVDYERSATPIEQSNHGYGVTGIRQITAGDGYTCAVGILGDIRGWGSNSLGQLGVGDGPFADSGQTYTQAPRTINSAILDAAGGVNLVSAGLSHTCAVLADGTAACWGANGSGQLGIAATSASSRPTLVVSLSNVVMIASGNAHSCAAVSGGGVQCWGHNGAGQLGDGTSVTQSAPVSVKKLLP